MTANIGTLDRVIRIVLGLAILSLYFVLPGNDRFYAFIGLIPLGTALIRWCPLYRLIGLRT